MDLEKIRRRAKGLGVRHTEHLRKDELIQAIQIAEGKAPCFDQPWCRPSRHDGCNWKQDCHAHLKPCRGLILSRDIIIGHQIATLMSSSYGWSMQVVNTDKQAYNLILQGDMDAVVADIDGIDLGGLAVLAHTKYHWPTIKTFAITKNGDLYIKKLARDMGGCEGFFYLKKEKIELDTRMGLGAQLIELITRRNHTHANLPYVSATK